MRQLSWPLLLLLQWLPTLYRNTKSTPLAANKPLEWERRQEPFRGAWRANPFLALTPLPLYSHIVSGVMDTSPTLQ